MKTKKKIFITSISNREGYYHAFGIEKSKIFLDNLQDFVVDIGVAKVSKGSYDFDGKSHDVITYSTLISQGNPKNDFEVRKFKIGEFGNGEIASYFNKEIKLLVIFLKDKIKLIFFCDEKKYKKVVDSLLKFCQFMKVK